MDRAPSTARVGRVREGARSTVWQGYKGDGRWYGPPLAHLGCSFSGRRGPGPLDTEEFVHLFGRQMLRGVGCAGDSFTEQLDLMFQSAVSEVAVTFPRHESHGKHVGRSVRVAFASS